MKVHHEKRPHKLFKFQSIINLNPFNSFYESSRTGKIRTTEHRRALVASLFNYYNIIDKLFAKIGLC